jgi:hypothetical protein
MAGALLSDRGVARSRSMEAAAMPGCSIPPHVGIEQGLYIRRQTSPPGAGQLFEIGVHPNRARRSHMRALKSRISGLSTCILFLGLAGCQEVSEPDFPGGGPSFAPAEVETTLEVEIQDFVAGHPCLGEEVHWTGKAVFLVHEVSNRGAPPPSEPGFQHLDFLTSIHLVGTGLESGNTYLLNSTGAQPLQSPSLEEFPFVDKLSAHEHLILPGSGVIGTVTFNITIVQNANGEVTAEVVFIELECD